MPGDARGSATQRPGPSAAPHRRCAAADSRSAAAAAAGCSPPPAGRSSGRMWAGRGRQRWQLRASVTRLRVPWPSEDECFARSFSRGPGTHEAVAPPLLGSTHLAAGVGGALRGAPSLAGAARGLGGGWRGVCCRAAGAHAHRIPLQVLHKPLHVQLRLQLGQPVKAAALQRHGGRRQRRWAGRAARLRLRAGSSQQDVGHRCRCPAKPQGSLRPPGSADRPVGCAGAERPSFK